MKRRSTYRDWLILAPLALVTVFLTGCGTARPGTAPPPRARVTPPPTESPPRLDPIEAEEMSGEFISFGKLRTVIRSNERVIDAQGGQTDVSEIGQALERGLVQRDFRIFTGSVTPAGSIAELTRRTGAHLVIDIDARSEFLNSTGHFTRYRAVADVKAIRGRDGTLLASNRLEDNGPRRQDSLRAGRAALEQLASPLVDELIRDLMRKSDQLLWAAIVINQVPNMAQAQHIRLMLEQRDYVDHVELLAWDQESRVATYEVIYGLQHEADIAQLLSEIPQLGIRPSRYEPGRMDVLRRNVSRYK